MLRFAFTLLFAALATESFALPFEGRWGASQTYIDGGGSGYLPAAATTTR
jgi:hypothetical protein